MNDLVQEMIEYEWIWILIWLLNKWMNLNDWIWMMNEWLDDWIWIIWRINKELEWWDMESVSMNEVYFIELINAIII